MFTGGGSPCFIFYHLLVILVTHIKLAVSYAVVFAVLRILCWLASVLQVFVTVLSLLYIRYFIACHEIFLYTTSMYNIPTDEQLYINFNRYLTCDSVV